MRISKSLLVLGFLILSIPVQTMAGAPGGFPYTCGDDSIPSLTAGLCTGSVDGCPVGSDVTTINCPPGGGTCNGTDGRDCIIGSANADVINAGKGDDTICGYGGADWIKASYGRDTVCGGYGADVLEGGWGADKMDGEQQTDTLDGGQCNDNLLGGSGSGDVCKGGLGDDQLVSGCETSSLGNENSQTTGYCNPSTPPPPQP